MAIEHITNSLAATIAHFGACEVEPSAAKLITFGERQIAIAYDLDDSALQRDLGPMPLTPLEDGIRRTLDHFRRLQREGRLDTADLDGPKPAPVTVIQEA